jgi:flagellar biogenesis protein FliO
MYFMLLIGGILMIRSLNSSFSVSTFSTLITIMTLITLGAYLLIRAGMKKGDKKQGIFILAGIGGKFLAYLILILI